MHLAWLVVIGCLLALLVLAVLWYIAEEYRGRTIATRRRVLVNLVDDRAITGILWRRTRRLIIVRGAELMEPGREPVSMDGEVVVDRDRVAFVQTVASGG